MVVRRFGVLWVWKVIWSVGVGGGVLLFDAGGESGFDDVDQFCRADSGVD